jgi:hypothetical protein
MKHKGRGSFFVRDALPNRANLDVLHIAGPVSVFGNILLVFFQEAKLVDRPGVQMSGAGNVRC